MIREATAESLRRDGFAVRMAGTGPDGLAAFREHEPSLAILDVMLPGFGGVELCREIRRDSQVPIVFLSPAPTRSTSCSVLEAGADDYVTKPFEPAVLAARVRAALRRARPGADAGRRRRPRGHRRRSTAPATSSPRTPSRSR